MFSIIVFIIFTSVNGQPCEDNLSVELNAGETSHDGTVVYNGVTYPPKYVFLKNVSGKIKTFGCLCELKQCIRKCCPFGSVMDMSNKRCSNMTAQDAILNYGVNISLMSSFKRNVSVKDSGFGVVFGTPCRAVYVLTYPWFLQEDGKLYIELEYSFPSWVVRGPDKYCIDTFVDKKQSGGRTTKLIALMCLKTKENDSIHFTFSSSCMLVSCVFLLATVVVYAWLPELRNLHGKVLMAYLLCLFMGFGSLSTMQILLLFKNIKLATCLAMTFVIYFFFLTAFFWLNVMCFDIWWTFSGKRGLSLKKRSTRTRFCAYALYAFGVPTGLTIVLAGLEFSGLPAHPLMPNIAKHCFLRGQAQLIYLDGPIMILCVANIIFFILTAVKITQIKKQTSVLKSKESSTHDQHRNDTQRLLLYVKLFAVMGINWILEVTSVVYPEASSVWKFTDAYNMLTGLIIFIIFVCKRKIFRLIKKRYKHLRGKTQCSVGTQTIPLVELPPGTTCA